MAEPTSHCGLDVLGGALFSDILKDGQRTFAATSHNLVGDLTCGFTAAGDLNGVSPKLGPLQNNGGPTTTVAPAFDSPAIDAADGGACPAIDQRGIARPQGAACDIGAFELVPNDAPTCVDYANSTFIATPLSDVVACSDPDAGDTFTVAQVSGPSNGVLTLNADGTFTYVPSSGFAGTDSVTFQATDSRGALSNVATATITIPDRSPNCPDYTGTVYLERTLDGSVGCTDPDAGDTLTVSLVSAVSHGILTLAADGTFIYTPAGGFLGTDTFAYQATDSFGALSAVGNAIITVSSRPPTCQNFSGSVLSGVTLSVGTETNVICTDPDGDTFTYSVVTGPAHGLAFISFRGTGFEYASSRTYIGSDSFTYTATDMHGIVSNIATATIQVVDTAPTCLNLTASVGAGGSLPLLQLLSRSCSDPDPFDSLTYSFVTNPAHGTLNIAGGLAYLANSSYLGPDSFTYQATDSRGVVSNVGTATIQVVNTGTGINVEVFPDPSVYLSFRNVGTAGTTTAVPSTTGPASPAGFQIPGGSLYWEISTTATYALQGIEVCISAPAGVANPRLLHYQGGAWVDVTTRLSGTFVCGSVASLSPFVVAIPVSTQSFSNLAYTGGTTAVFGPLAMSARLTNATTHAGLGARSVTFSVDGGAPIAATTSADGTATATTPLPLAPGSHMVDVGFAGDQSSLASSVHATVIVSSSSRGSVVAKSLKPITGGPINLKVHADSNRLKGHLHYDDGPRGSKPLEAKTMIAFGVAADGDSAWVAAVDKEGHSFLVHAVDTGHGKHGVDTLTLWIDGVLQTGDGALRAGDVRIDPDQ